MIRCLALAALLSAAAPAFAGIRFEISTTAKPPGPGRLLVTIAPTNGRPSFTRADPSGNVVLGIDTTTFPAIIDGSAVTFPLRKLDDLPAGDYRVQAAFLTNRDILLPSAPGNLYCDTVTMRLDPKAGTVIKLTLDRLRPDPQPKNTATHRYLALPSKLLSDFHGRSMVYRLAVILPSNFDKEPDRKYALLVHIGGFGQRSTSARGIRPDPRFVQILLDGSGPFGDPYQVNSANNGPYGDTLTREVIPYVEKTYRCLGTPQSRFTTGGSTGGWVSLALQVFYPDFFNGSWSQCPDGVDFRAFQLIDIYADANAYTNRWGFERPARRTIDGDTVYTIRHECQLERVLGRAGRWELGGQQWASWNAVYGPRGSDGLPVPLWDANGVIDRTVAKHWEKYDLGLVLERNWATLGPKLAGKIHVWVGDADDYFLNNAVHRLKAATAKLTAPPFDGQIIIEIRKGHGSGGWTRQEMLDAMAERAGVK